MAKRVFYMSKLIFPENFIWGVATASYQIEGSVADDGRGESIWDRFSHTPGKILNGDTGDVACDHYRRYKQDVQLMKELGIKGYRFSVAWPRIYPQGRGQINRKGIDFYSSLVDELLNSGIEPAVTLYHWDLPQALQDLGGWANRDVADYFAEYAFKMYDVLGDRVKKWITHNEPWVVAFLGNAFGVHAPGYKDYALAVNVSHNLILSHAKAVQAFRQSGIKDGQIGITLNLSPVYPASDKAEDMEAVQLLDGCQNRWFLDPVVYGAYPEDILALYREKFNAPVIKDGDMEFIAQQPVDFIGVNYYSRAVVKKGRETNIEHVRPEGVYTEMDWEVYPEGLYDLLIRLHKDYNAPVIYITENGAAFKDDKIVDDMVDDQERLDYLKSHFEAAHKAIQDGVKLKGYYVWSFMDNFEWSYGYSKRFGIVYVDYDTMRRTPKKSALWYRDVIENNSL
jgi:beta-glucosidase